MDYLIKAKIPRKLFDQNKIGEAANTGLNALSNQAQKLGLDLKAGEFVNVNINITGNLMKPKIGIKLVGTDGQTVQDEIKDKIDQKLQETKDSIKNVVNEKIDDAKNEVNEKVDSVKNLAQEKADSIKKVAEEKVDEVVDTVVNEVTDKVNDKIDEAKDKVKDEVGAKVDTILKDKVGTKIDSTLGTILGAKKDSSSTKDQIKDKLEKWNPFKKKKQK
jgi:gas vesicle protein